MSRVAVTGAAGPVGRRVVADLVGDVAVTDVVAIDRVPMNRRDVLGGLASERLEIVQAQLKGADLDGLLTGVDVLCHLAGSDPLEGTADDHDLHAITRVLDAAGRAGVGHVIVRSSATVYGAWSDNPVPLSESAALRPNGETTWVDVRAEIEARVARFAGEHPATTVSVLRPCVTVSERGPDELGRVLAAARLVTPTADAAPAQFVHADDVAAAVAVVRRARAAGTFNVAPDGSLDADMVRALIGGAPRLPLPEWAARRLTAFGWRYQLAPTPPGFVPFVLHPWVVANDRLRALGWEPSHANEEAFVIGHDAPPWASISPQRRQELALGVAGTVIVGAAVGVGAVVRRQVRRR